MNHFEQFRLWFAKPLLLIQYREMDAHVQLAFQAGFAQGELAGRAQVLGEFGDILAARHDIEVRDEDLRKVKKTGLH